MDPSLDSLLAASMAHPDVDDATVLERATTDGGTESVVYLVTGRPDPESIVEDLAGRIGRELTGVAVTSLPLDGSGALDEAALERIPVVDERSLGAWEERIRSTPGIGRAAVISVPWAPPAARIHVEDVAPEADTSPAPAFGVDSARAAVSHPSGSAPAVAHGGPLRIPPGGPRTLVDTLRDAAAKSPKLGLRFVREDLSTQRLTYPDLLRDAERILGGLRSLGFAPGDRVILQLGDQREFLVALWGCALGGMIPVPIAIAPSYREPNAVTQKLAAAWRMLGRPLVVTSPHLVAELAAFGPAHSLEGFRVESIAALAQAAPEEHWYPARPEDVALIMLTSGSTGTPKGVKLTHANLVARSFGVVQLNGFSEREITLNWTPLDHAGGILLSHLRDVFLGCDQLHCPTDLILADPLRWLELIDRHRCTVTFAPNFAYALVNDRAARLRDGRWDLRSLRCFVNGGEAIVPRTARRFVELLIPHGLSPSAMWPAWGMSETSSGVTCSHRFSLDRVRDDDSFVEVGPPIAGVSLRVVDEQGRILPEGATGHLEVAGTTLMAGYYDSSLDADAFTADRWFRTGDLALIREGRLTITGRAKDVIIINGANYYSHELESVVEEVAGVSTSFVAACPVRAPGQDTDQLAIFFHAEPRDDAELLEIVRQIRQRCVRGVGLNPDHLIPVRKQDIPKTEIGKIQRLLLAQRFAAGVHDAERKRIDLLVGGESTMPDWFFRRSWIRSDRLRPSARATSGTWVVFVDDEGLGASICDELRRRGEPVLAVAAGSGFARPADDRFVIDPAEPAHYARVIAEGAPDAPIARTLHLWTFGAAGREGAGAAAEIDRGAASLLSWIQALASFENRAERVDLVVVSSGAQSADPDDVVDGARAAVLGLVLSAPQELGWLDCRHLDVPVGDPAADVPVLLDELLRGGPEREVAYRAGRRLVSRMEKAWRGPGSEEAPLRVGGRYVLTGGLGGVGFEVARFLLERYQARLLLVGRSDPGRGERADRLELLRGLGGEVRYARLDVGDADALRADVEAAERAWGAPLDGAFHLAGLYRDRPILEETPESLREVLHPKLAGTRALLRLLDERPGTLFVGFSSVIAAFGGALVAAYACANAALEGAAAGTSARGSRRVCLSWSTWENVGISRVFGGAALLRAKGYLSMSPPLGLVSLVAGLRIGETGLYVGLDGSNANVRRKLDSPLCARTGVDLLFTSDDRAAALAALRELELRDRFGTVVAPRLEWRSELALTATGAVNRAALAEGGARAGEGDFQTPTSEVEEAIARVWRATLRRERIDVRDNFFDLGGNSLLLAQASAALSAELKRPVSLTDVFQYSTVRALALHLAGEPTGTSEELGATISRGAARADRIRARRRPRS